MKERALLVNNHHQHHHGEERSISSKNLTHMHLLALIKVTGTFKKLVSKVLQFERKSEKAFHLLSSLPRQCDDVE